MIAKSFTALASAALVATFAFAGAVEAGCGGVHGGGYRTSYSSPSPAYAAKLRAKRAAQARAVAAAKRRKQIEIAQARAAQKARAAHKADIAAAKAEDAKQVVSVEQPVVEKTVATAKPVEIAGVTPTCSKFIAATGTTVEVECSAQ